MYTYTAKLLSVIDGNTVDAEIDLGFNVVIKQRIKLFGVDTDNLHSPDVEAKIRAVESKAKLIELLPKEFVVETILNKRGKFGRVMGQIYVKDADKLVSINEQLIAQGVATKFDIK